MGGGAKGLDHYSGNQSRATARSGERPSYVRSLFATCVGVATSKIQMLCFVFTYDFLDSHFVTSRRQRSLTCPLLLLLSGPVTPSPPSTLFPERAAYPTHDVSVSQITTSIRMDGHSESGSWPLSEYMVRRKGL